MKKRDKKYWRVSIELDGGWLEDCETINIYRCVDRTTVSPCGMTNCAAPDIVWQTAGFNKESLLEITFMLAAGLSIRETCAGDVKSNN